MIAKAKTSFLGGSVWLLEIYDFNKSPLNFHVLCYPVPLPVMTTDFFKDCSINEPFAP